MRIHSVFPRLTILLVIGCFSFVASAQSVDARSRIPIELLNGPDHQDIPWKITITQPKLMFQQRYLVEIRARISAELVSNANDGRSLRFALKVQDENGRWLADGQYNEYDVPSKLSDQKEIEYASGVYFRPGNYTIALIAFDSASGHSSVVHRAVRVEPLKEDPFPEIDRYLPTVEFPKGFPQQEVAAEAISQGELFPIAHQKEWVAIDNRKPVQIDIVLNVSKRGNTMEVRPNLDPYWRRGRMMLQKNNAPDYHVDVGRILQIGNVLAHMQIESGCIRVSAMDALRAKTVLDRSPEDKLEWERFEDQINKFDQNTVDAGVLANRKRPAQYVHKFLEDLSADGNACGSNAEHIIIVVSHGLSLPSSPKDERLTSVAGERARFYYLQNNDGGPADDLSEILKDAKPQRLGFSSAREFRKSFGRLVTDLRGR